MKLKMLLTALAAATVAVPASAVTYATGVEWTDNGTVAADRAVAANALGTPDGIFLSLGLGGMADFTFGHNFTAPASVFEITYGDRARHLETAEVYLGYGGTFTDTPVAAFSNNSGGVLSFTFTGIFDTLRLVDTSSTMGGDGFDVDAVSVSAVPLPAGAALLLGGLGVFGLIRRKHKAV